MSEDKWAQLERWLQRELKRSMAHRDHREEGSAQYIAWKNAVITLTDVIEKMAEIESGSDRLPQEG
jgi:hypothetical protein